MGFSTSRQLMKCYVPCGFPDRSFLLNTFGMTSCSWQKVDFFQFLCCIIFSLLLSIAIASSARLSISRYNTILMTSPYALPSCKLFASLFLTFICRYSTFSSVLHYNINIFRKSMLLYSLTAFPWPYLSSQCIIVIGLGRKSSPELAVQIKIYLQDWLLVEEADCCSAGIDKER